jgi:hypothetical protein
MRYCFLSLLYFLFSCNGEPLIAPSSPETVWVDAATYSDTIITNVNNQPPVIYYAAKNWQSSADTNLSHGYRFIAIRYADTISVKHLNDSTTNYKSFICGNTENSDTLKSQNFLDTIVNNPVRNYVHLN